MDIAFELPVSREHSTLGWYDGQDHWRRPVRVESDGDVLAIDPVSDTYSRHHDLSAEELARAKRIADGIRRGTHYVVAGNVFRVAR